MTGNDIAAGVASTLQVLVQLGVAPQLAELTGVSEETIYRHARDEGAKGRPKRMDGKTFKALADLFLDLGVLESPDYAALRAAEEEIRNRAIQRAAKAGARVARRARGTIGGGRR